MTLTDLIAQIRSAMALKLAERNGIAEQLEALRDAETTDEAKVAELRSAKDALDAELDIQQARVADLEGELARDNAATALANEVHGAGVERDVKPPATVRVGQEARTYNPGVDPKGKQFCLDVARSFMGVDPMATARLSRHMTEEMAERGAAVELATTRAVGTGAFAGLVVPQYLADLVAPLARANRPFADICNLHDLPPEGMSVNLSRITTGTDTALQASENAAVQETNIDDTLLTIPVQTIAGQQTISRQAVERGAGVEDVTLDDLFRAYATRLDATLLNQAATGLTAVATTVAYTDASPTTAEMYPKVLESLAGVEAALLDQDPGDNVAVMHSRRWYWMQNSVGSTWPLIQQPGINTQQFAANYAEAYGSGFRGVLPNGTPVIVDNNVGITFGTNEDEVYIGSKREWHLWEDPTAPMLIRAEQPAAAALGILLVVYGYVAYTHTRYAHTRKIAGTGLITPAFTGA